MYTQHDPVRAAAHRTDYQNQSLAYSNDGGITWKKYGKNPVLKNPGIEDFRDPKLMWYEPAKEWIVTLAVKDRISFYSSKDLKNWKKESDFGWNLGAHGGVWECPDLFPLQYEGKTTWVLIVNINPGGPNKGSATQYFLGSFDGKKFVTRDTLTRWLDFGPDEYAGITWYNTGGRRIFIGWMSNWLYANQVPTRAWRNAMTVPREIMLKNSANGLVVASQPVAELSTLDRKATVLSNITVTNSLDLSKKIGLIQSPYRLDLHLEASSGLSLVLSNGNGQSLLIAYDEKEKKYSIDRTHSGKLDFSADFPGVHSAPRISASSFIDLTVIVDNSSVELFADKGLTVMTEIFFPDEPFNGIQIKGPANFTIEKLKFTPLKSIWP